MEPNPIAECIDLVEKITKPKRGGRKPGSKNKPKVGIMPAEERWAELSHEYGKLIGELAQIKAGIGQCIELLQQALSLRIGMMDSDSRVHDIQKQRAQLEQEAHQRLRAML